MSQWLGYYYVKRKDLGKNKARVFTQYDTRRKIPEERIEVKKTGDEYVDIQHLLRRVREEVNGKHRPRLEKETETAGYQGNSAVTIKKYFICLR